MTSTDGSESGERRGLGYAAGLDGVRALAVTAVVAYHLGTTSGATVLPGGFLGVDLFFVLSGYLITSLLIVQARQHRRISIKDFYIRRARRLLPALFTVLLTVAAIGAVWLPQQATRLRGDLLAALGYATNWWLIAENSSYFAGTRDRPDLLTHLWSLAVEEQYYLVWPLVLTLFFLVRARRWVIVTILCTAVAASTTAAFWLYDPFGDPSRVYYGTDTRASAPLLGALLAVTVQPWRHRDRLLPRARRLLDGLGITALVSLAIVAATLTDTDDILYGVGFLGIALLGTIVVGVAGHPGTALGRILALQPWKWLGERSYGIYLWHWPVCVLTRPGTDIPMTGSANAAVRVGLSLALAELSYRLVETPIRRHGFVAPLFRPRTSVAPSAVRTRRSNRTAVLRATVFTVVMIVGGTAAGVRLSAARVPVAGGPVDLGPDQNLGASAGSPGAGSVGTASHAPGSRVGVPDGGATAANPPGPRPAHPKVVFFGDSQGMTLLLNKPVDVATYLSVVDDTIEGCGVLLGKVASRSGEKRNLTANCRDWQPEWAKMAAAAKPDIAVVMIGAWDVFDLTLDTGATLAFPSTAWDANFTAQLTRGVDTVRAVSRQVVLALLPCYRPIKASAGFWPERGDDARTRHVNDLLRTVAAGYPEGSVGTVAPPAQFCTDPAIAKNTAYRWDGVHYYKQGSALYFSALIPQLLPA